MGGRRPLVGVSSYLDEARWGAWTMEAALLPSAYVRLVQAAGGIAVVLPPDADSVAAEAVAGLDGVVIAGGPDVDPARYGAERHPRTGPEAAARDAWELALIGAALDSDTPLRGICRGMQLLNVHLGGTLHQHLPDVVGHHRHNPESGIFTDHLVTPVAGTRLAELLPGPVKVPTHHHQAIDRLGGGLVVSAHAEDGIVEAVELPAGRHPFALAVQWHPEADGDPRTARALVEAAGGGR